MGGLVRDRTLYLLSIDLKLIIADMRRLTAESESHSSL